ncbi:DREBa [Artemisia annua]|uniref:DREBa n=1 Tax=Artemisia annua TaxID=35608 RepID=A0A2U1MV10_ARTAN|nr:DREBa [Artemisia annua]
MLASQNPRERAERKKFKETPHPIYRGVRSRKFSKRVCEVRHPITQSRVSLGLGTGRHTESPKFKHADRPLIAKSAVSCALVAISALGIVPSHTLDCVIGCLTSHTHLPNFLLSLLGILGVVFP